MPQFTIASKRDGLELTKNQIFDFIDGVTKGTWESYQTSALLMAIYLKGMTLQETAWLTEAMLHSGDVLTFPDVSQRKIDKHSTGGVGDKISLHLAPMVAACGITVPMVSGRGLGHSGGTLDKLESIPGFNVNLSNHEFKALIASTGLAIMGQTKNLAPADKTLYALRDVTATVESIPLICASILSKKLAEGIDGLVLDVKHGAGAFMKTEEAALELASYLSGVAELLGKPTTVVLTAMDEPLGHCIGNSLEVIESVAFLKGEPAAQDLTEVTYALGAEMLLLGGIAKTKEDAIALLENSISSGRALEKWEEMVLSQHGDLHAPYAIAPYKAEVIIGVEGYIAGIDAYKTALLALELGAGRKKVTDQVDHSVGIQLMRKVGDYTHKGDVVAIIYAATQEQADESAKQLAALMLVQETEPEVKSSITRILQAKTK